MNFLIFLKILEFFLNLFKAILIFKRIKRRIKNCFNRALTWRRVYTLRGVVCVCVSLFARVGMCARV